MESNSKYIEVFLGDYQNYMNPDNKGLRNTNIVPEAPYFKISAHYWRGIIELTNLLMLQFLL